jgi:hypothetical protein
MANLSVRLANRLIVGTGIMHHRALQTIMTAGRIFVWLFSGGR